MYIWLGRISFFIFLFFIWAAFLFILPEIHGFVANKYNSAADIGNSYSMLNTLFSVLAFAVLFIQLLHTEKNQNRLLSQSIEQLKLLRDQTNLQIQTRRHSIQPFIAFHNTRTQRDSNHIHSIHLITNDNKLKIKSSSWNEKPADGVRLTCSHRDGSWLLVGDNNRLTFGFQRNIHGDPSPISFKLEYWDIDKNLHYQVIRYTPHPVIEDAKLLEKLK